MEVLNLWLPSYPDAFPYLAENLEISWNGPCSRQLFEVGRIVYWYVYLYVYIYIMYRKAVLTILHFFVEHLSKGMDTYDPRVATRNSYSSYS